MTSPIPRMEGSFQKDALEQYGPMGPLHEITALIQGGEQANTHGIRNAAGSVVGKLTIVSRVKGGYVVQIDA